MSKKKRKGKKKLLKILKEYSEVITIVILALLVAIGTWLFAGENAPAKKWIQNIFEEKTGASS
mgnify:CR=1 FL=1